MLYKDTSSAGCWRSLPKKTRKMHYDMCIAVVESLATDMVEEAYRDELGLKKKGGEARTAGACFQAKSALTEYDKRVVRYEKWSAPRCFGQLPSLIQAKHREFAILMSKTLDAEKRGLGGGGAGESEPAGTPELPRQGGGRASWFNAYVAHSQPPGRMPNPWTSSLPRAFARQEFPRPIAHIHRTMRVSYPKQITQLPRSGGAFDQPVRLTRFSPHRVFRNHYVSRH